MKKQILIGLISVCSILTVNAQTWTGSSDVNGNLWRNGNVGIGIPNPLTPLHVYTNQTTEANILTLQNIGGWSNGILHNIIWKDQTNAITGGIGLQYDGNGNVDFKIHSLYNGGYKTSSSVSFVVKGNGNVGIGTTSPTYKLDVCGTIRAREVKVDLQGGCDFVFKNDYKLMDLKKLEEFVKTNQHLPEIASEKEMVENGVNMKDLQMKLLQKMEEMTLYMIGQNKKLEQQNEKIITLENEIKELKTK